MTGVRELRPEATARLARTEALAWRVVDPVLLEIVRLRVATLLCADAAAARRTPAALAAGLTESTVAQVADYATSPDFGPRERTCLAFAEQCVLDVSGVSDADRAALAEHLDQDAMRAFVTALYVLECSMRLELMTPMLLGTSDLPDPAEPPVPQGNPDVADLRAALGAYQDAVVRGTALDPVVTELVRLRCARTHDCRICRTLRLADAREAGVDDAMTDKVDFFEASDLPERTKLALRITDAFITMPTSLPQRHVDAARAEFTPEQLAELCLDITKWSTQKIHVALGTDGADRLPVNADGVSFFAFGADGRVLGYAESATEVPQRT